MYTSRTMNTRAPHAVVIGLLATSLLSALLTAQAERTTVGVKVPGGKVAISYTPTDLKGRSIGKDLRRGDIWRMSAGAAAELVTEVPLLHGVEVFAAGSYRLSARYLGNDRFTLLLFHGPSVYQRGTPYREIPIRLHEETRKRERLSFRLGLDREEGPKGEVRFRMHWGDKSLRFNLQVLPTVKAKFVLGGKPATLTFFGVPRNKKSVDNVKAGIRVHFGTLVQDGEDGIRYDLFGVNTRQGYHVECRNFTVPHTRLLIEAREATASWIADFLKERAQDTDKARATQLKKRLVDVHEDIKALKTVLDMAENLPRKVKLSCKIQRNPEPNQALVVSVESADEGKDKPEGKVAPLRVLLSFGRRTAVFTLDQKGFK